MGTPYRADHVGSFLRPAELLKARQEGADPQRLRAMEDRHIQRVLARQKELGFEIFTDGELRRRTKGSTRETQWPDPGRAALR
ncbi:MAG: hypothetical protein E6H05_00305 [Bacillati bacterium ANGP1]|uniref:Cobalamin-independent methionine synthase MetE C-terminal/archaeal domain-containing protein n=1 Tax=Candidatus Segetimicrobium genomatis TaxID=2569760 RepID=A0A537J1C5_9BACT|nr:MAG: hypothetical protein E6H05_00305 [Terrabacteria group bacterium ANGP1]